MRKRSKVLLTVGILCLSAAVVAGPAAAHKGKNGENDRSGSERSGSGKSGKAKIAKSSKVGKNLMKLEVRGTVTAIDAASVTVSAGGTLAPWTCAIPTGSDTSNVATGDRVKLNCRASDGTLTATKLKKRDKGDKVKVEARGAITALGADSITVAPGGSLPTVTCAITDRTRQRGTPAVGEQAKVSCKSKNGQLVAKTIKEKAALPTTPPATPGNEVEVKGAISALSMDSITVGSTTCAIGASVGTSGFAVGSTVEIKCTGNPLTLVRIKAEDDVTSTP